MTFHFGCKSDIVVFAALLTKKIIYIEYLCMTWISLTQTV